MKLHFHTVAFLVMYFLVSGGAVAADHFLVTPQGTRYQDLKPGMGEAAEYGDVVTMHFVGWLDAEGRKGKEIYNSRREREPVSFVVGTDRVMQGWSDGVIGMKAGGKRLLMLPPALGYGSKGVKGVIPPDASLLFVIDVMSIEKLPD
ncbi:MAG: FKBP-type peptidyl-prolyl cis-trans isomerase [Gammaproteobacteria bacterium]